MKKKFALGLISICYVTFSWGQSKKVSINAVKTGVFYYYPTDSNESFSIVRDDSLQKETNLTTGVSSFWQVKWVNDSIVNLRYLSRTNKISAAEELFYNSHSVVTHIKNVTRDYYTFRGGLDSINGLGSTQDTLWRKTKKNI